MPRTFHIHTNTPDRNPKVRVHTVPYDNFPRDYPNLTNSTCVRLENLVRKGMFKDAYGFDILVEVTMVLLHHGLAIFIRPGRPEDAPYMDMTKS